MVLEFPHPWLSIWTYMSISPICLNTLERLEASIFKLGLYRFFLFLIFYGHVGLCTFSWLLTCSLYLKMDLCDLINETFNIQVSPCFSCCPYTTSRGEDGKFPKQDSKRDSLLKGYFLRILILYPCIV